MSKERRIALANVGRIDPESLESARAAGAYAGLAAARAAEPARLVEEVAAAGLRGRGGAGFPSGVKMRAVLKAGGAPKYVVANADEGEPGTFKDRAIMEGDPHLLVEGLAIAARAVGASRGFIYIRGEYALAVRRVRGAVEAARAACLLGPDALGAGMPFDVEVRTGAGSYLCGEELTLLESLEGRRGHPRIKPPFPAERGLFGKPTLVHNVETLAHLPAIVLHGAAWYRGFGTAASPGTKIFNLSGDVARPGTYECDLGIPLSALVDGFGGGVAGGRPFKAALLGGAAGTFVDASFLDAPMEYDALAARGATLGSGAVIVFDDSRSVAEAVGWCLEFFAHESCGKCVPCRVGVPALHEAFEAARRLGPLPAGLSARLVADAERMAATSLCPLGASPVLPLRSAAARFPGECAVPGEGGRP